MSQLKSISLHAAAAAKSLQSCPSLCDPIDGSPPGSPVPGILQTRTLEWVTISFSNAWKWKVKVKSLSCIRLFATPWTAAYQAPLPMGFPGKSTGVGCHWLNRYKCPEKAKINACMKWWVIKAHWCQFYGLHVSQWGRVCSGLWWALGRDQKGRVGGWSSTGPLSSLTGKFNRDGEKPRKSHP